MQLDPGPSTKLPEQLWALVGAALLERIQHNLEESPNLRGQSVLCSCPNLSFSPSGTQTHSVQCTYLIVPAAFTIPPRPYYLLILREPSESSDLQVCLYTERHEDHGTHPCIIPLPKEKWMWKAESSLPQRSRVK